MSKLRDFFMHPSLQHINSFPIKAYIPLIYTINANIHFSNFNFEYFLILKIFKKTNPSFLPYTSSYCKYIFFFINFLSFYL